MMLRRLSLKLNLNLRHRTISPTDDLKISVFIYSNLSLLWDYSSFFITMTWTNPISRSALHHFIYDPRSLLSFCDNAHIDVPAFRHPFTPNMNESNWNRFIAGSGHNLDRRLFTRRSIRGLISRLRMAEWELWEIFIIGMSATRKLGRLFREVSEYY